MKRKTNKRYLSVLLILALVLTAIPMSVATAVAASDVTSGLVAEWKFDGNTSESQNGIGVLKEQGITYADGVFGKAAVFGGRSYIETVAKDELLTGSSFTFSAWVFNEDSEGKTGAYVQMGKNSGWVGEEYFASPYLIYNDWGTQVRMVFSNEYAYGDYSTSGCFDEGGAWLNGRRWQLVTVTYDGFSVKQYINSRLAIEFPYEDGVTDKNDCGLLIGANEDFSYMFEGMMDNLRIYNRAITEDEVGTLYTGGTAANKKLLAPEKEMVAYYSFNDTLADASANKNDAVMAESESAEYTEGALGNALELSSDKYAEIQASDLWNMNQSGTISFWAKLDENDNESNCVLSVSNPTLYGNSGDEHLNTLDLRIRPWDNEISLDGTVLGLADYGANFKELEAGDRYTAAETGWHHYATVFYTSGGKLRTKTYVDGVLEKTNKFEDERQVVGASGTIRLGFDGQETYMNGALDELKVFNYARTATQIKAEYKEGAKIVLSGGNSSKLKAVNKGKTTTVSSIIVKTGDTTDTIKSSRSAVKFKSSNKKVFTVTSSGKISGKKAGTAKLTITYGSLTKTYTVKVK